MPNTLLIHLPYSFDVTVASRFFEGNAILYNLRTTLFFSVSFFFKRIFKTMIFLCFLFNLHNHQQRIPIKSYQQTIVSLSPELSIHFWHSLIIDFTELHFCSGYISLNGVCIYLVKNLILVLSAGLSNNIYTIFTSLNSTSPSVPQYPHPQSLLHSYQLTAP